MASRHSCRSDDVVVDGWRKAHCGLLQRIGTRTTQPTYATVEGTAKHASYPDSISHPMEVPQASVGSLRCTNDSPIARLPDDIGVSVSCVYLHYREYLHYI